MESLSINQEKAIGLLLAGLSKTETAKALGVSRGTIYNWLKLTAFQDSITFQRGLMASSYLAEAELISMTALGQLSTLLTSNKTRTETKLMIIRTILQGTF